MSVKARALYFVEPGKIELREERLRKVGDHPLVRSRLIGVSHGTEMLAFRGQLPAELEADATLESLSGSLAYPLKYGYINVGVTGDGKKVFSFYPHQDLFYCPPEALVEIPDDLEFDDAVFLANMETALGVVHDTAVRFGEQVLIVGQGVVGLLVAEILARSGVGRIVTVEAHPLRRQASARIGCLALEPGSGLRDMILEYTDGHGVDTAINVSASAEGLQLAIDCLAFEGTVVEASWYGKQTVELDLGAAFHRKRLRLISSQVSRINPALQARWNKERRFEVVLRLLKDVRPSKYISHRFALDRAQEAFELLDKAPGQSIQVVFEP